MARQIKKTDKNKAWAKKVNYIRNEAIIKRIKKIFLIYCEGSNTEPLYFESFPVNTETLVEAIGLGKSRTSLIGHIIDLANEREFLKGQKTMMKIVRFGVYLIKIIEVLKAKTRILIMPYY